MSTSFQWMISPLGSVLWKWTLLLALGWLAHGWLRRHHPRWRLILWRGILIFSLALPLVSILPLPALVIPLHQAAGLARVGMEEAPLTLSAETTPAETAISKPAIAPNLSGPAVVPMAVAPESMRPFSWKTMGLAIWLLGCVCGAARLIWFHLQLARLLGPSEAPSAALAELTEEIRSRFGARRKFRLRVSGAIQSPFVYGLWRPIIVLPQRLMETLSTDQTAALLRHEMAHLRGNDLLWSAGWRWLQVVGWFQPLVWKIPSAHSFACEQEADRLASGPADERENYAQMLAQLTLRVLALPRVETELTLNGTAQIVRRLAHLQGAGVGAWTRRHSVTGLCLVGSLFLIAVGCKFGETSPETSHQRPGALKKVMVEVQDEDGKPLSGAMVQLSGFRVQGIRSVDWYGWDTNQFGPANPVTTDRNGKAWLKYPVVANPSEKLLTGALTFTVSHPDYCPVVVENYSVDGTGNPFRLTRGVLVEVSGHYGADRQPVPELVLNLSQEGINATNWQKEGNGIYTSHQISAGHHLIQLMGRLPSGEIVFSDTLDFTTEPGKPSRLEMEMKPGIRIEGRLDDNVPRPVKNGRVLIDVRPPQMPAYRIYEDAEPIWKKYGYFRDWHTWRPIAPDGTFVFESVPPGQVDVIAHGDGFVSKSIGKLQYRSTLGKLTPGPQFAIPQPFPLTAPVTKIVVATEPTATLELTAKTESGKPIEGATVDLYPNVFRMGGIFGNMNESSEEPFRVVNPLPPLQYSGTTDSNGWVEIRNLPAEQKDLHMSDPTFEVPLHDQHGLVNRRVPALLSPGVTNTISVTMEPIGTDFIGTAR